MLSLSLLYVSSTGTAVPDRDERANVVCAAALHADHRAVRGLLHRAGDIEPRRADVEQVRAALQRHIDTDADAASRADSRRQLAYCRAPVSHVRQRQRVDMAGILAGRHTSETARYSVD